MDWNRTVVHATTWLAQLCSKWRGKSVNFCKRLIAVRSLSTSNEISISTMFSSAFGPQRAVTDARQEGEPKVWIWVVFALERQLVLGKKLERDRLYPFSG